MAMDPRQGVPSHILKLERPRSVAVYDEYADAAQAVDYLSDRGFPVHTLSIVGTDLKSFEKVTGELSWSKVLLAGFTQGIAWAFMVALLMYMMNPEISFVSTLLFALIGFGLVGMGMSAIQYRMRGGKRDFTSATGIIATHYEIFAEESVVATARRLLGGESPTQPVRRTEADVTTLPPPFGQTPSSQPRGVTMTDQTDSSTAVHDVTPSAEADLVAPSAEADLEPEAGVNGFERPLGDETPSQDDNQDSQQYPHNPYLPG